MEKEIQIIPEGGEKRVVTTEAGAGESLSELFKQLAQDSTLLVKQEVALAKAEISDNVRSVGKDVAYLAMGGGILLIGVLVLTAFLVVFLGDIFDNYWVGALIIGLIYTIIGAVLLNKGKKNLQHENLKPDQTIATLKEDKRWAAAEVDQVKRGLSS